MSFRDCVVAQISAVILKLYGVSCVVLLEKPKDIADAAFPCFQLAKTLKRNPHELADEIAERIEQDWISKTEAINGYVNVYVDTQKLAEETITCIHKLGDNYGKGKDRHKTIIVEHTSANPNGPLHVGESEARRDRNRTTYRCFSGYYLQSKNVFRRVLIQAMGAQQRAMASSSVGSFV